MKQVLFLFLLVFVFTSHADNSLNISQAWVQEGPPNARVLAGFMDIENMTPQDISIESASSDSFKHIEFHQTINENGMARMRQQKQLLIKSGSTLKLEYGGYHLMLIKPTSKLKAGDKITIQFILSNKQIKSIELMVKKPTTVQEGHEHHHHHH